MVSPISESERRSFYVKLKVGLTVLIAASAGLTALQANPSPLQLGGAILGGVGVGAVLAWFVVPDGESPLARSPQRQEAKAENPFTEGDGEDEPPDGSRRERTASKDYE